MVTRICRIEIMAFEQNLKRMKETTETVSRKEYRQQIPGLPIVSNHIHGQNPDLRTHYGAE
jgi:septation ring formation regulator EzrA